MGATSISPREPTTSRSPVVGPSKPRLLKVLGPGLISGAANDDPTAIATYSQAGARFGFVFCWLMPLVYPMMAIVQQVSARIGRTTGHGLAGNIRRRYPGLLLQISVALLPAGREPRLRPDRKRLFRSHANGRAWQRSSFGLTLL